MARYPRNTLVLFKIETTSGTDAVPTPAADAVLIAEATINPLNANNIDRTLLRAYFGASEQLVGTANISASITVEAAGSGAAATAPQWGDMLIACAAAESLLSTPNRVEYAPTSTNLKTGTMYWYDDGVLHKAVGVMGNAKFSAKVGDRAKFTFDYIGVDAGISAATPSAATYTAWRTPPALTKLNVVDITLGCTYAAGALTGGTVYPSTGLEMDIGNAVSFTPTLSTETVDITDRQTTGSVQFDLTAAQEVTFMASVKANTLQSLGLTLGTAAGNKLIVYAPKVQLLNPTKQELNGRRMLGYQARFTPNTGNDEWLFVTQ